MTRRDTNIPMDWFAKLPAISRDLEVILYDSATSLQAYTDKRSLHNRLLKAAIEIRRNF